VVILLHSGDVAPAHEVLTILDFILMLWFLGLGAFLMDGQSFSFDLAAGGAGLHRNSRHSPRNNLFISSNTNLIHS
jgi:hypothetical protein